MAHKIFMFNGTFSARKYTVKRKEKIMIASYGETSGFVPISGDEQAVVNGGLKIGPCGPGSLFQLLFGGSTKSGK
jgi:hypothetical protein